MKLKLYAAALLVFSASIYAQTVGRQVQSITGSSPIAVTLAGTDKDVSLKSCPTTGHTYIWDGSDWVCGLPAASDYWQNTSGQPPTGAGTTAQSIVRPGLVGLGTLGTPPTANLDVLAGTFALGAHPVLGVFSNTGTQNNFFLSGTHNTYVYTGSGVTLSGLCQVSPGKILVIVNNGTGGITLQHQNAGSNLGCRVSTGNNGIDHLIPVGGAATLRYDNLTSPGLWNIIGASAPASVGKNFTVGQTAQGSADFNVVANNTVASVGFYPTAIFTNTTTGQPSCIRLGTAAEGASNFSMCVNGTTAFGGYAATDYFLGATANTTTSKIHLGRGVNTAAPQITMTVDPATGNVGVGTTTPTARLQVNGTVTMVSGTTVSNQAANFTISNAQVEAYSTIKVAQTTAGVLLTSIAAPTSSVTGRLLRLHNTGSAAFTYLGDIVNTNTYLDLQWNGTVWAKDSRTSTGTRISQFVALNTPVVIDNLRIEASLLLGQGIRLGTVSGTMSVKVSAVTSYATDSVFASNRSVTLTTVMTAPFIWTGQTDADAYTGTLLDLTNNRAYEFTVMTNTAPTLSYISIQRTI